ncbi:uncharacterized protein K452DRAFT_280927 [Aplosporella prunicola CBS 121167]|uniref:Sulfatase N-terminal domain-containing protein n=1 Tax=Aplosporella prunicola CBS 121167 TaxID=1176127 RepID=A0A6A6AXY2_9PEZI|nr:uncharacterized protein K452DRAFT_280927 [Aplosporella prunicola CBS 121167]KAF2135824.1 hypothetical protein K452DRAFT_280927 [Aplosporella prunicola CBS 121167]
MLARTKNQYSLFIVSSFASKLLHLYTHRASLPILLTLLYTPTFLLPDALLITFGRLLVYRQNYRRFTAPARLLGAFLAFLTATTSAAQITFYLETGGEVQWMAAGSLALDPAGLGLILSGLPTFSITLLLLTGLAWLSSPYLYDSVDALFARIAASFKKVYSIYNKKKDLPKSEEENFLIEVESQQQQVPLTTLKAVLTCCAVIAAVCTTGVLQTVRPHGPPYAHMSGSLPITLVASMLYNPVNSEFCLPLPIGPVFFPVMDLQKLEPDVEWGPPSEECHRPHHSGSVLAGGITNQSLSTEAQPHPGSTWSYNPKCDPLKVSNLDDELLESVETAVRKQKPIIKNVMLISLESTRKDLFPMKKDSELYKKILGTYDEMSLITARDELDAKLAALTPNAEFLTGESSGFGNGSGLDAGSASWRDAYKGSGAGGINVQNAITGSAFTLKSLLTSICGVDPLPVDFTEETKCSIYQPCLPQVLDLFNKAIEEKNKTAPGEPEYLSWPWESAMVQAVTDKFDSQDKLHEQMGFGQMIVKDTLENASSKFYPPKEPMSNYFGYPETEVLPYMRNMFVEARQQNRRLFLSHLTSTTHHPFAPPKGWDGREEYLKPNKIKGHDAFDNYLNTVKYQDEWIGKIFNMLEEVAAINETLVVLVGDHGMAFTTPDGTNSNFENGYVTNFDIPLVFAHPHLPSVQLPAKVTPTSILPTILDLLLQTGSIDQTAAGATAHHLLPGYQGQSLIRELGFTGSKHGSSSASKKQPWHFSIINPGGSVMAVSSGATPYRLIMPLCSTLPLRFTDTATDPLEHRPVEAWNPHELADRVARVHGRKGAEWALLASRLGRWWYWEQRERWGYHRAARSTDRSAEDSNNSGKLRKDHWWET